MLFSPQSFSTFRTAGLAVVSALLIVALGTALSGCFFISQGVSAAAETAGEEVGEAAGQQLVAAANLPPAGSGQWNRVMVNQAQMLFGYAFSAGGMWPAQAEYEPGEWTTYQITSSGNGGAVLDTLERAHLKTTSDGNEWWRVRGVQDGEAWVYEALLNPQTQEVRRLRTRDPNGEVGEVPVTEQTVYQPPQELTEESIEGATVGTRDVTTPAGTFTARQVEYQGTMGRGTITWFLTDAVPGHVVKYKVESDQQEAWTSTLIASGSDATTRLGSY